MTQSYRNVKCVSSVPVHLLPLTNYLSAMVRQFAHATGVTFEEAYHTYSHYRSTFTDYNERKTGVTFASTGTNYLGVDFKYYKLDIMNQGIAAAINDV